MNVKWDTEGYIENFGFVHEYGEDVISLIDAKPGSFVIDLGCGSGALSEKLREKGYEVLGIDASEDMVKAASESYPDIRFVCGDAVSFKPERGADVVFSNAVMHWIDADKQEAAARNIFDALVPGGDFVCEFGGSGCAETVHAELARIFEKRGLVYKNPFFFPTIGEYAPILEKAGFTVRYAVLFDRPTVQKTEDGLADWIRMFDKKPFEGLEPELCDEIIAEASENLRPVLFKDGKWIVDYVRIRIKAERPAFSENG